MLEDIQINVLKKGGKKKGKILTVASSALAACTGVKPIETIVAVASGSALKSGLILLTPGGLKGSLKSTSTQIKINKLKKITHFMSILLKGRSYKEKHSTLGNNKKNLKS